MPDLKPRAKTLVELADIARFYVAARPMPLDDKAAKALDAAARELLAGLIAAARRRRVERSRRSKHWSGDYADSKSQKLGDGGAAAAHRADRVDQFAAFFEVMRVLGRDESLGRIRDVLNR